MNPPASSARTLSTAEDRREAVLAAAMPIVAERGLKGTPTADVAKAAGISHAYLFRLFPTKNDLTVAVLKRVNQRIYGAFAAAAAKAKAAGEDPMMAMGQAYGELLADRELLLLQMHGHAAAAEDETIREVSRDGFARLLDLVERETAAEPLAVGRFFATGMLMNVMAALDAAGTQEHWAQVLTGYCLEADQD
jgi:AcrR family transcriptional regulator